jgi:hypothetical protein
MRGDTLHPRGSFGNNDLSPRLTVFDNEHVGGMERSQRREQQGGEECEWVFSHPGLLLGFLLFYRTVTEHDNCFLCSASFVSFAMSCLHNSKMASARLRLNSGDR